MRVQARGVGQALRVCTERPLRIALFTHALDWTTVSTVILSLADEFRSLGASVTVLTVWSETSPALGSRPDVEGRVVELGGSRGRPSLWSFGRLRTEIDRARFDLLISNVNGQNLAAIAAVRALPASRRPRLIVVEHNHYSSYGWRAGRIRHFLTGSLYPLADRVVGVSPGVCLDLEEQFPALRGRTAVVPEPLTRWGALDELAREPVDHPWFTEKTTPVVVTVGLVMPRKDHETLVLAIAHARRLLPDALRPRLAIIGRTWSDAYEKKVRRLIHELGLDGAVELLGYQENPLRYVSRATAFAFSSVNEGLGIALLEAMACGVPVVSTDCPSGPRWLLEDGECGLLAPMRSPAGLGDAIARLIIDQVLRGRLISRAYRRVDEFTPRRVAERYLDVAGLACWGRS